MSGLSSQQQRKSDNLIRILLACENTTSRDFYITAQARKTGFKCVVKIIIIAFRVDCDFNNCVIIARFNNCVLGLKSQFAIITRSHRATVDESIVNEHPQRTATQNYLCFMQQGLHS